VPKRAAALLLIALFGLPTSRASAYSLKRTRSGALVHWERPQVEFALSPQVRSALGRTAAEEALTIAMEAWRGLPGVPDMVLSSDLERGAEPDPTDGINGVYMARGRIDGDRLAVTRSTYDASGGVLVDADIIISPAHPFGLLAEGAAEGDDAGRYDLASVLAHEMGHVLGLGETMDDPQATMWPYFGRGETHARTIETDDESGAMALYDGVELFPAGVGCGASILGRRATPWPALLIVLGLGIALGRRGRVARRVQGPAPRCADRALTGGLAAPGRGPAAPS